MTDIDTRIMHLEPARVDAALHARDVLVEAAAGWAVAAKSHTGAVQLPGDRAAALAFDAFFEARRELAHHIGADAAADVAEEAFAAGVRDGQP